MQDQTKNVLIAGIVAIIVTVVWNMFLQVPPQYAQGVAHGEKIGQMQYAEDYNKLVADNKKEGVFTPTSSGMFYLEVK